MKTQMRFGSKDVEVYFKTRGSTEGYKQMKLQDLLSEEDLPGFNHKTVWKRQNGKNYRRKIDYSARPAVLPSKCKDKNVNVDNPTRRNEQGQTTNLQNKMVRQRSIPEKNEKSHKKPRTEEEVSKSDDEYDEDDDEDEDEEEEDMEEDEVSQNVESEGGNNLCDGK